MSNFIYMYIVPSQKLENRGIHVGESDNENYQLSK